jgi:hypothetical protein
MTKQEEQTVILAALFRDADKYFQAKDFTGLDMSSSGSSFISNLLPGDRGDTNLCIDVELLNSLLRDSAKEGGVPEQVEPEPLSNALSGLLESASHFASAETSPLPPPVRSDIDRYKLL